VVLVSPLKSPNTLISSGLSYHKNPKPREMNILWCFLALVVCVSGQTWKKTNFTTTVAQLPRLPPLRFQCPRGEYVRRFQHDVLVQYMVPQGEYTIPPHPVPEQGPTPVLLLEGYQLGLPTIDARFILGKQPPDPPHPEVRVVVSYFLECTLLAKPSPSLYVAPDADSVTNATSNCTIDAPCDLATAQQLLQVCYNKQSGSTCKDQSNTTIFFMPGNYSKSELARSNLLSLTLRSTSSAQNVVLEVRK
jgi:hypothetical protein